jgi:ribosome assembly protein YihI (activator of Der GTPase)
MELLTMKARRTNWNDDRLDELSRRVDDGFKEMREGFARVDAKFDRVNARLDKLIFTMWAIGGGVGAAAVASLVKLAFF